MAPLSPYWCVKDEGHLGCHVTVVAIEGGLMVEWGDPMTESYPGCRENKYWKSPGWRCDW